MVTDSEIQRFEIKQVTFCGMPQNFHKLTNVFRIIRKQVSQPLAYATPGVGFGLAMGATTGHGQSAPRYRLDTAKKRVFAVPGPA